jgi:hypothetical protein
VRNFTSGIKKPSVRTQRFIRAEQDPVEGRAEEPVLQEDDRPWLAFDLRGPLAERDSMDLGPILGISNSDEKF